MSLSPLGTLHKYFNKIIVHTAEYDGAVTSVSITQDGMQLLAATDNVSLQATGLCVKRASCSVVCQRVTMHRVRLFRVVLVFSMPATRRVRFSCGPTPSPLFAWVSVPVVGTWPPAPRMELSGYGNWTPAGRWVSQVGVVCLRTNLGTFILSLSACAVVQV